MTQDAEGGGLMVCEWAMDVGRWVPVIPQPVAIEASIRADYEELVKAAQRAIWLADESGVREADAAVDDLRSALTRIEESLGGRKDG